MRIPASPGLSLQPPYRPRPIHDPPAGFVRQTEINPEDELQNDTVGPCEKLWSSDVEIAPEPRQPDKNDSQNPDAQAARPQRGQRQRDDRNTFRS